MKLLSDTFIGLAITGVLLIEARLAPAWAAEGSESGVSGNLRTGFITTDVENSVAARGTAIGGHLGYTSPSWNSLSVAATFFTTQDIGDSAECSFFSSTCGSYSILGKAFVQGNFDNTLVKVGRFGIDTPYADTDDIRMVPNNFQGVLITNNDIAETTVYTMHLTKWSGVDANTPEDFTDLNADQGVNALGGTYEGINNTVLQAWYYNANDFASLAYAEVMYKAATFNVGAQYASQNDDGVGVDGDVTGVIAKIQIAGFALGGAYNSVDGIVTNGFGGGPFFTSADDHTIASGMIDENAQAVILEYDGLNAVSLSAFHVNFNKSESETNYVVRWENHGSLNAELIYADMNADGTSSRLMLNYAF